MALDVETLTGIVTTFGKGDWVPKIIAYAASNDTALSKRALRHAQGMVETELARGHAGRAFNWAFLLVHWTEGHALDEDRFCELFRPTKHEQQLSKLTSVLKRLSETTKTSGLTSASEAFMSWASYCDLFAASLAVQNDALDKLRRTDRALAWLVSYVEEAFAFDRQLAHPPTLEKLHRFDLGKEEAASSASYLLGRYFRRWGFSATDFQTLGRPTEPPRIVEDVLLQAFALVEVRSLEPTVFRFGSRCVWVDTKTVEVSHPNDTIDISLELGYIKTQSAGMNARNIPTGDSLTFNELCDRFRQDLSPKIITYAVSGPPRLRIEIPQPVARVLCDKIIMAPGVFSEEQSELISLCWELSTTPEELQEFRITPNLTMINLLQIGRLFRLLASARNEHLDGMRDSDPICYWNSMLGGVPSKEELAHLLSSAGIPTNMAHEYVELFVWNPTADSRPLDIQYTSFLPFDNRLAIPFNIHSSSNALRNALVLRHKRLYEDGTADPLSMNLQAALLCRTPHARIGFEYRWKDQKSDVDVLALFDDCVYVFECKNTLLPCSAFERRTFWDYLHKAVDQLDQFRNLWDSNDFRTYLAKRLGWPITRDTKISTCIVPSVRLYSGAHFRGHPVRHIREIVNVLGHGEGTVISATGEVINLNIWGAPEFSSAVLDEYLSKESALYQAHWSAMEESWEEFKIGRYTARSPRYGLDLVRLEAEFRARGFVIN